MNSMLFKIFIYCKYEQFLLMHNLYSIPLFFWCNFVVYAQHKDSKMLISINPKAQVGPHMI